MINLPTVSSGYSIRYCQSGTSRKSSGAEQSGERVLQKTTERERSAEREVAERERSGELRLQKQVGAWSEFFAAHAPSTCSVSSNKTPELAGPEVQLSRPGYRPSSQRV